MNSHKEMDTFYDNAFDSESDHNVNIGAQYDKNRQDISKRFCISKIWNRRFVEIYQFNQHFELAIPNVSLFNSARYHTVPKEREIEKTVIDKMLCQNVIEPSWSK